MKITDIETFVLRGHVDGPAYWGARTWGAPRGVSQAAKYPPAARRQVAYAPTVNTVLVRLQCDDGNVGWGECKAPVAPGATALIVDELLKPIVLASDLEEINVIWERMYASMSNRGHSTGYFLEAISGVDIALWDAWARMLRQPLTHLLGGRFRSTIPVYASAIPASGPNGIDRARDEAHQLHAAGFDAVKVAIGVDPASDVATVAAVTEIFGTHGAVLADASGKYDGAQAEWVGRRLADLGCGFFEMPLPTEDIDGYARLASCLPLPLALDTIVNRHQALQFLRVDGLEVLQPDVSRAGGVTGTMRIAALADVFGAQTTPHVSIGSAVHFAASLQLALAIPNCQILEHWTGTNPLGRSIASDLDEPHDGVRTPAVGPGLGITVDEERVRELATA